MVVSDKKILSVKSFGVRNIQTKSPMTSDSVFAVASLTKSFTVVSAALLIQKKILSWTRPVVRYLPKFRLKDAFATSEVNLQDLLTHNTGLPRHDLVWYGAKLNRESLLKKLRFLRSSQCFRCAWQYQNIMYTIAGYLVGKRARMRWERFVERRILKPLGMNSSFFSTKRARQAKKSKAGLHIATPHRMLYGRMTAVPLRDIDTVAPAAGLYSTPRDMTRWLQFFLRGGFIGKKRILSKRTLRQIYTPHIMMPNPSFFSMLSGSSLSYLTYGLGWVLLVYRKVHLVYHVGRIDGFTTLVSFIPKKNLGILVFTNTDSDSMVPLMLGCYARLLGYPKQGFLKAFWKVQKKQELRRKQRRNSLEKKRQKNTFPTYPSACYMGRYFHPAYGEIQIKSNAPNTQTCQKKPIHSLSLHFHTMRFHLRHYQKDTYQAFDPKGLMKSPSVFVKFFLNRFGQVDRLSIPLQPGISPILFTRKCQPPYRPKATSRPSSRPTSTPTSSPTSQKSVLSSSRPTSRPHPTSRPKASSQPTSKRARQVATALLFLRSKPSSNPHLKKPTRNPSERKNENKAQMPSHPKPPASPQATTRPKFIQTSKSPSQLQKTLKHPCTCLSHIKKPPSSLPATSLPTTRKVPKPQ